MKTLKNSYSIAMIIYFVSSFSFNVSAQIPTRGDIKGIVVDEQNKPVASASILLKMLPESGIYKIMPVSNQGFFLFDSLHVGDYTIEIKALGYNSLIKSHLLLNPDVNNIDLGILQLTPALELKTVNIMARAPLIETRADKIIVNLANIELGSSVMEVLDRLPGVRVSPEDRITLNGQSIRILIDGRPSNLSGEALKSFLRGMSSATVQKIELIDNPSSKYEVQGSGGIINIIKKRNINEGLTGSIYGGFQQSRYGRNNKGITLNFKNKVFNLLFNFDYAYNKYFQDNKLNSLFNDSSNKLTLESISVIHSLRSSRSIVPSMAADFYLSKRTTISFSGNQNIQFLNKSSITDQNQWNSNNIKTTNFTLDNELDFKSTNYASNAHLVHHIDTLGENISFDLDYSNYSNFFAQKNADVMNDLSNNFITVSNTLLDQHGVLDIYALKLDYSNPINDGTLEIGAKMSHVVSDNENKFYNIINGSNVIDPLQNNTFRYSENINALYISFNKKYKKISFQAGLRTEYTSGKAEQVLNFQPFSRAYTQLFPSISFMYKFNAKHNITINANKRLTRPAYENLNPFVQLIDSRTYTQGNPNLRPTISYNSTVRYAYNNALFISAGYNYNLRDLIYFTTLYNSSGIIVSKPSNNRYTDRFNLGVTYSKTFSKLTTSNGINLSQQGFKSDENGYTLRSSGIPTITINSYQGYAINKKLSFQLLFNYLSKIQERNIITKANYYFVIGAIRKISNRGSISINIVDPFNTYNSRYNKTSDGIKQTWDNHFDVQMFRTNFTYAFGRCKIKQVAKGSGAAEEKSRSSIREN
jgi:hypothetical protein